jgi:threonyl-tRNA synthetase
VKVATITDRLLDYAGGVRDSLLAAGIRVELDGRPEKVGFKVREAALQKVPYILVVGDKEAQQNTVAVRERGGRDLGAMQLQEFIALLSEKIRDKSISTELTRG